MDRLCCVLVSLSIVAAACAPVVVTDEGSGARQAVDVRAPTGESYRVLVCGGTIDDSGRLRGAQIVIRDSQGCETWDEFNSEWDPWLLRSGRFAGQNVLLVGVRKATVFDPPERKRPFLYAVKSGGVGLEKVWLGTSLSRPFVTADFGDIRPGGEDELVALERTRLGPPALGAYRWRGFGVEGIGRSEGIRGARDMACADVWTDAGDEVIVRIDHDRQWQFVAYHLTDSEFIAVAEVWAMVGDRPAQWLPRSRVDGRPGAIRLSRGAVSRTINFRPLTPPNASKD